MAKLKLEPGDELTAEDLASWQERLCQLLDAEAQQGWSVIASFQACSYDGQKEPLLAA